MARDLTQTIQGTVLNRRILILVAAAGLMTGAQATESAHAAATRTARLAGHPSPGDGRNGVVVDPTLGGYYPWAHQPGARGTSNSQAGGTGGSDHSASGGSNSTSPMYCKQAAAALVAVPTAVLSGTPVDCAAGQAPAPTVTPQQLAQQAWSALHLPLPDVRTAPPRASADLVGLPEWVWVPRAQWAPISRRASAGAVWAEVTATPKHMTIKPGAGLAAVECSGPGTAYDPGRPASVQQTDCSYTYRQSSATEPGAAYRVTVTVVWGGSWTGSDGAGGTLPDISRSTTFSLRVAEAQGLYG